MYFIDEKNKKHEAKIVKRIPHHLLQEYLIEDLQEGDLIYCQPILDFIEDQIKGGHILPETGAILIDVPDFGVHSLTYLFLDTNHKWLSLETTSPLQKNGRISS